MNSQVLGSEIRETIEIYIKDSVLGTDDSKTFQNCNYFKKCCA